VWVERDSAFTGYRKRGKVHLPSLSSLRWAGGDWLGCGGIRSGAIGSSDLYLKKKGKKTGAPNKPNHLHQATLANLDDSCGRIWLSFINPPSPSNEADMLKQARHCCIARAPYRHPTKRQREQPANEPDLDVGSPYGLWAVGALVPRW
jgi:hypothetical protein